MSPRDCSVDPKQPKPSYRCWNGAKKCPTKADKENSRSVKHRPCYKGHKCQTTKEFKEYLKDQNPLSDNPGGKGVMSHVFQHEKLLGGDPQRLSQDFILDMVRSLSK